MPTPDGCSPCNGTPRTTSKPDCSRGFATRCSGPLQATQQPVFGNDVRKQHAVRQAIQRLAQRRESFRGEAVDRGEAEVLGEGMIGGSAVTRDRKSGVEGKSVELGGRPI